MPDYPTYGGYEDSEVFCRMCEKDLPVLDVDWASDGFNWGNPAPPNRSQRVLTLWYQNYTESTPLTWIDGRSLVP